MSSSSDSGGALLADLSTMVAQVVGRRTSLFRDDVETHDDAIRERIEGRRVLITGAAGSIGSATVRQIARYRPARLAALDLSENSMVELVRDLRSRRDLDLGIGGRRSGEPQVLRHFLNQGLRHRHLGQGRRHIGILFLAGEEGEGQTEADPQNQDSP